MLVKITLTEDHLKLIPMLFIQEFGDDEVGITREQMFNLGSHLLEDMALILGLMDKAIPNTEDDPNGRAFEDDAETYMLGLYEYLNENLFYIETLIHQYACKGGITSGTYKCRVEDLIWEKIS